VIRGREIILLFGGLKNGWEGKGTQGEAIPPLFSSNTQFFVLQN